MTLRPYRWLNAAHGPPAALVAASAAIALLAWAVGVFWSSLGLTIDLWPLGVVLLGWLSRVPSYQRGGRRSATAESRLRMACAAAAAVAVGGADAAWSGGWHAGWTVAAGVLVPLATLVALQAGRRDSPATAVAVAGNESRLLMAAMACALVGGVLRGFDGTSLRGGPLPIAFGQLIFGDLISATVFLPLGSTLGGLMLGLAQRMAGAGRADADTPPAEAPSVSSRAIVAASCGAILLIAGISTALRLTGHADTARLVAVAHLLAGLVVARSIPGTSGALLLVANGFAMLSAFVTTAMTSPVATSGEPAQEAVTLLLLAGVFALQSMLQSVTTDGRSVARTLIQQALHVDLSSLPNPRAIARIVDALLARPRRSRFWMVSVVLPDVARWSELTDRRAAGALERTMVGRLKTEFEPIGGRVAHPALGRFLITLGDRVDGLGIRQKLRAALGGGRSTFNDPSMQVRFHAGIVEVPANAEVGSDAVLDTLSMAMQRASIDPSGIHRATVSSELIDEYRTELRTLDVVTRALDSGRLRLFVERIEAVSTSSTAPLHYEILARIEDEDGRLLQPREFLPAVWNGGMQNRLDRLVFVRTVAHLAQDTALHEATRLCSINVFGPTLCDPDFPDYVQRCLDSHRVDPQRLMIEITESHAISDMELARAHVARLSAIGLSIALDDFGTGLATFDYLKRLKADVLKIDGSFVRHVVDDPVDREIVSAITRLARATGARTVAEWVETPEQRAALQDLGVDYLQGRLISSPEPIESLKAPKRPGRLPVAPKGLGLVEPSDGAYEHGDWRHRLAPQRGRSPQPPTGQAASAASAAPARPRTGA
jgi:EAL domain-containing protein (putative c-di-GMP-specific phosphodiesterase class I)